MSLNDQYPTMLRYMRAAKLTEGTPKARCFYAVIADLKKIDDELNKHIKEIGSLRLTIAKMNAKTNPTPSELAMKASCEAVTAILHEFNQNIEDWQTDYLERAQLRYHADIKAWERFREKEREEFTKLFIEYCSKRRMPLKNCFGPEGRAKVEEFHLAALEKARWDTDLMQKYGWGENKVKKDSDSKKKCYILRRGVAWTRYYTPSQGERFCPGGLYDWINGDEMVENMDHDLHSCSFMKETKPFSTQFSCPKKNNQPSAGVGVGGGVGVDVLVILLIDLLAGLLVAVSVGIELEVDGVGACVLVAAAPLVEAASGVISYPHPFRDMEEELTRLLVRDKPVCVGAKLERTHEFMILAKSRLRQSSLHLGVSPGITRRALCRKLELKIARLFELLARETARIEVVTKNNIDTPLPIVSPSQGVIRD
ncbi:hypothetical protein BDV96DRAFT_607784 [Lophiotrema nucula]|uniref:Uncharacterized protein n=1 Tax=Lophiotrema nucula TaxID=690887 RepID=A0A6A5YGF7_9PLEO|nr:hypothetical protein BDV96DRAFT_607784 [Lophiotrema nucula]